MILQVEHIVDTHFAQAESDLGERELDLASGIECDLETFHATIALTKSVLDSVLHDDGESNRTLVPCLADYLGVCRHYNRFR